jgi:GT2 family glycosyltransferase
MPENQHHIENEALNPMVSIIILNWNTTETTAQLLRSIKSNLSYSNVEVIVVDNGSKEDPSKYFRSIFGKLKIILNPVNYGFSAGCNIGMEAAIGDYFFLLNSDTEITSGLLEKLLETYVLDNQTGLVSPTVRSFSDKKVIEYAGYSKIHPLTGRSKVLETSDESVFKGIFETNFAYGAAMMIPRYVYERVGGLCEDYFAYYEELDWSNRIREKNFKIYHNSEALVYHKGSVSTATNPPFKTFLLTRNRMLFMKRNFPRINYLLFMTYFLLVASPKHLVSYLISFEKDHFLAFLHAINSHLRNVSTNSFQTEAREIISIKSLA